jgi:hypothetical protein
MKDNINYGALLATGKTLLRLNSRLDMMASSAQQCVLLLETMGKLKPIRITHHQPFSKNKGR